MHSLIAEYPPREFLDYAELNRRISDGPRFAYNARSVTRANLVIALLHDNFRNRTPRNGEVADYLAFVAEQWLLEEFFDVPGSHGVTRIPDERYLTGTDEAKDELSSWVESNLPIPPPPKFPPTVSGYLDAHSEDVASAEDAFRACESRKRDDRLLKFLGRFPQRHGSRFQKLRTNTRGNWCLGDLLIALETPSDVAVYTTDKHFDVLCQALGKAVYRPEPQ